MGDMEAPRPVNAPPGVAVFMPMPDIWNVLLAPPPTAVIVVAEAVGAFRLRLEPVLSVWCTRSGCTAETESGCGGRVPSAPGPRPPTLLPPPKKLIW